MIPSNFCYVMLNSSDPALLAFHFIVLSLIYWAGTGLALLWPELAAPPVTTHVSSKVVTYSAESKQKNICQIESFGIPEKNIDDSSFELRTWI